MRCFHYTMTCIEKQCTAIFILAGSVLPHKQYFFFHFVRLVRFCAFTEFHFVFFLYTSFHAFEHCTDIVFTLLIDCISTEMLYVKFSYKHFISYFWVYTSSAIAILKNTKVFYLVFNHSVLLLVETSGVEYFINLLALVLFF